MAERVLLTLLGTSHKPATYRRGGAQEQSEFASIALLRFLPEWRPDRIRVWVTAKARQDTLPGYQQALAAAGFAAAEPFDLVAPDDVDRTLQDLVAAVPPDAEVRIDLTHAYRHLALFAQALVGVLEHTRGVDVVGLHYGIIDGEMLDLEPLFALPAWAFAVRAFAETGSTAELATLVGDGTPDARETKKVLGSFDVAYRAGLPLEAGREAARLIEGRKPFARALHDLSFGRELQDRIRGEVQPLAISASGPGWKRSVPFDAAEEARQFALLRRYVDRQQWGPAVCLAREWLISKAVVGEGWLERKARTQAERRLNQLASVGAGDLDAPSSELRRAYLLLRDSLRNYVMHAGMRPVDGLADLHDKAKDTLLSLGAWVGRPLPLDRAATDARCLISPIGLSPGALFTALVGLREAGIVLDTVIAVGSAESLAAVPQVTEAASYPGEVLPWSVADPHGGYAEVKGRLARLARDPEPADRVLRSRLAGAAELYVNVAGGTTLLGYAVDGAVRAARAHELPTLRLAVADRRPPADQRAAPFVLGELYWLDEPAKVLPA